MKNQVIVLSENLNSAAEFDHLLNLPDRVFFLVLGDSNDHADLVKAAAEMAEHWRWVVWAKQPSYIHPRLSSLKLRPGVLKVLAPWPPEIFAVSISINNYICRTVTNASGNMIAPAFILAETFMQP